VSKVVIFMPLLDEGADVWRPVEAEPLGNGRYRVLGMAPEDEAWAFVSGSTVKGAPKAFADGTSGLAVVDA
jgi:hypothetical protein